MKTEQDGARAIDFYATSLSAYDNGLELDGSEGQPRCLRNRSRTPTRRELQPIFGGPAYAIRNVRERRQRADEFHALERRLPRSLAASSSIHNTFVSPNNALANQRMRPATTSPSKTTFRRVVGRRRIDGGNVDDGTFDYGG